MIVQAKFTYFSLGKAFEKQTKTIENQGGKQIKAIEEHEKRIAENNALVKKDDLMIMTVKKKDFCF